MIDKPGIYLDVSEKDYHDDPVIKPSLSSSIAKLIYDQSPRHAKFAHPRLTPNVEIEESKRPMDVGSALHKFMLGRGREVQLIPHDNYLKKEAKALRDDARRAGMIPVLQSDFASVELLNAAAVEQLHELGRGDVFASANTEVTLVWQEANGVWCRARLDALPNGAADKPHLVVPELKTTAGSADLDDWTTTFFANGNDVQAAFYRRGLMKLLPTLRSVEFEWIVLEQKPPYALNILTASNQTDAEAAQIVQHAIDVWGRCMESGEWPGYNGGLIEAAPWRSMKREMKNAALLDRMAKWQAP